MFFLMNFLPAVLMILTVNEWVILSIDIPLQNFKNLLTFVTQKDVTSYFLYSDCPQSTTLSRQK